MIHAWKGNASLSFNIRERREGKTLIVESRLEGRPGFLRCNNAGIFYQLNKGTQHFAMNIQQLHSGTPAQTSDETEKASVWFVVASQKLTVWSEEDCSGPRNGRITRGQLGWVCLPHHRRPAKSQGLWPQEVAAAPAGPHQARDYTTSSRSSSSSRQATILPAEKLYSNTTIPRVELPAHHHPTDFISGSSNSSWQPI